MSFMILGFWDMQPKYLEFNKKVFIVFKEIKHFQPKLLKSQTKIIVPYPSVRNILV